MGLQVFLCVKNLLIFCLPQHTQEPDLQPPALSFPCFTSATLHTPSTSDVRGFVPHWNHLPFTRTQKPHLQRPMPCHQPPHQVLPFIGRQQQGAVAAGAPSAPSHAGLLPRPAARALAAGNYTGSIQVAAASSQTACQMATGSREGVELTAACSLLA